MQAFLDKDCQGCYEDDGDEVFIGRDLAHAKNHSEVVASEIDREVKSIIDDCYAKAKAIIIENEPILHKCADLLLEKERISREEFEALFTGEDLSSDGDDGTASIPEYAPGLSFT